MAAPTDLPPKYYLGKRRNRCVLGFSSRSTRTRGSRTRRRRSCARRSASQSRSRTCIAALDRFFNFSRASLSLSDFLTLWRLRFDEANAQSGPMMNDIGKSYLLLRASGLSERAKMDFCLQINGDLSRYEDIVGILARSAANDSQAAASTVPQMARNFWQDGDWQEDPWSGGMCYWQPDDAEWNSDTWYGDGASWSDESWQETAWSDGYDDYGYDGDYDDDASA